MPLRRYPFWYPFLSLSGDLGLMGFCEDPSKPLKTGCLRINAELIRVAAPLYESKSRVFESCRAHHLESITCSKSPEASRTINPPKVPVLVPVRGELLICAGLHHNYLRVSGIRSCRRNVLDPSTLLNLDQGPGNGTEGIPHLEKAAS